MAKKIVIIILIVTLVGVFYWRGLNAPANPSGQEQIFVVARGETIGQIADNLRTKSLLSSPFYFKYLIRRHHLTVKAGEYLLNAKFSVKEIVNILTNGEILNQERVIRIIEGWNLQDIGDYLEKSKIASVNDFSSLAGARLADWKFTFPKFDFLNDAPKQANLEGFLFPDTYRVDKDAKAEDIVKKMLTNFDKKLTPALREEVKRQGKTIYEIIIMASLIEKEVRTAEDMKIVSGIFWNRIKNGEPLQSCATLAYALGINKKQYSLEDTKVDSVYNTYKYRGLPPGPIANPGLNAIKAAIYPTASQYNYFLSDPATGQTIFSKTLEEHNRNKAKYLE